MYRPENVERESEIVSQAGRLGAVTVATNMAGRGTDILLGGSPRGIARVLAKHLMLVKLGLSPQPSVLPPEDDSNDDILADGEVEVVEEETDEDVLSLPTVRDLAASLELWMPGRLSKVIYICLCICLYQNNLYAFVYINIDDGVEPQESRYILPG